MTRLEEAKQRLEARYRENRRGSNMFHQQFADDLRVVLDALDKKIDVLANADRVGRVLYVWHWSETSAQNIWDMGFPEKDSYLSQARAVLRELNSSSSSPGASHD